MGGFARADNPPRELAPDSPYANGTVQLVALADSVEYFQWRYDGFAVLLVNDSADELELKACDSQLPIVREAMDANGQWRPLEYIASSWCGNSYHRVYLSPRQYWKFPVPVYAGQPHRMRFRAKLPDGREVVSNQFVSTMQPGQFEGIRADGRLDPRLRCGPPALAGPPLGVPPIGPPAAALRRRARHRLDFSHFEHDTAYFLDLVQLLGGQRCRRVDPDLHGLPVRLLVLLQSLAELRGAAARALESVVRREGLEAGLELRQPVAHGTVQLVALPAECPYSRVPPGASRGRRRRQLNLPLLAVELTCRDSDWP